MPKMSYEIITHVQQMIFLQVVACNLHTCLLAYRLITELNGSKKLDGRVTHNSSEVEIIDIMIYADY